MKKMNYQLKTIGKIGEGEQGFYIDLDEGPSEALEGLEGFSHVEIFWWAHQLDMEETRNIFKVAKPYKRGPEELGIFATRSPMRPNPLAMTLVPVTFVDHDRGLLGIAYIDAEPGTPVLDIKPYYGFERVKEYNTPEWCAHWPEWYEDSGDFDWEGEFQNAR